MNPVRIPAFIARGLVVWVTDQIITGAELVQTIAIIGGGRETR